MTKGLEYCFATFYGDNEGEKLEIRFDASELYEFAVMKAPGIDYESVRLSDSQNQEINVALRALNDIIIEKRNNLKPGSRQNLSERELAQRSKLIVSFTSRLTSSPT